MEPEALLESVGIREGLESLGFRCSLLGQDRIQTTKGRDDSGIG